MITRSVRDTAAFLDAVGGADPTDIYHLPPPAVPYATTMSEAPDGLRIGYVESVEAIGVTVAADCVAAVTEAAGLLGALGHHVEPGRPARLFDADWVVVPDATLVLTVGLPMLNSPRGRWPRYGSQGSPDCSARHNKQSPNSVGRM